MIFFFPFRLRVITNHDDDVVITVITPAAMAAKMTTIGLAVLFKLELHKSSLHVHTVASPSSMHFSAPCIQQARNKTTAKNKIDVINMQTSRDGCNNMPSHFSL